jgi:hypothetical protein
MVGKKRRTCFVLISICVLGVVALVAIYAYDTRFRAFTTVYKDDNVVIEQQYLAGDLRITYEDDSALNRTVVVVPDYYDSRVVESVERCDDGLMIWFRNGRAVKIVGMDYRFVTSQGSREQRVPPTD